MAGFNDILKETAGATPPPLNSGKALLPPEMMQALMTKALNPNPQNTQDQKSEALMRMGFGMMQPVQPGQSPAGNIGQAMNSSINYLDASKRKDQDVALRQATTASTIQSQDMQRRAAEMSMQKMKQNYPIEYEILQNDLEVAKQKKNVGRVQELEAELLLADGGIALAKRVRAETEAMGLLPEQRRAAINASRAASGASAATTKVREAQLPGVTAQSATLEAQGDTAQRTAAIVGRMSDSDLLEWVSNTGKYARGTSITSTGAAQAVAKNIYSRLPFDSPLKQKYRSSADFETALITKKMGLDELKLVIAMYPFPEDMPDALRTKVTERVNELMGVGGGPAAGKGGVKPATQVEAHAQARAAISQGKPANKVNERLKSWGYQELN